MLNIAPMLRSSTLAALFVAVMAASAGLQAGTAGSGSASAPRVEPAAAVAVQPAPAPANAQLAQLPGAPIVRGLPSTAAPAAPTVLAVAQRLDAAPAAVALTPPPLRPFDGRRVARRARSSGHVPHLGSEEAS